MVGPNVRRRTSRETGERATAALARRPPQGSPRPTSGREQCGVRQRAVRPPTSLCFRPPGPQSRPFRMRPRSHRPSDRSRTVPPDRSPSRLGSGTHLWVYSRTVPIRGRTVLATVVAPSPCDKIAGWRRRAANGGVGNWVRTRPPIPTIPNTASSSPSTMRPATSPSWCRGCGRPWTPTPARKTGRR